MLSGANVIAAKKRREDAHFHELPRWQVARRCVFLPVVSQSQGPWKQPGSEASRLWTAYWWITLGLGGQYLPQTRRKVEGANQPGPCCWAIFLGTQGSRRKHCLVPMWTTPGVPRHPISPPVAPWIGDDAWLRSAVYLDFSSWSIYKQIGGCCAFPLDSSSPNRSDAGQFADRG